MIGRTLGSYTIERRLGAGGMGTVYQARHQVIGRRAAVKLLNPEHARNADTVQRFFNEARAAAAIEHPGIVDVLDVGTGPDGEAYLVMELLDGESMADRLVRAGALPAATVVRLLRQIAAALAAAHERGIVHRDLKPDNIFLVPDPETTSGERIKLLDFGIAKLHGALAADAPITTTGAVFGTPIYMSPEQCRGAEAVDHRADLYALGCIGFHAVCGEPPFRAAGLGDLLAKHMFEPPRAPRTLIASVPESLEAILLRLLAKAPAERFASAHALIAALDGGPVAAAHRPSAELATALPGQPLDVALAATAATLDPPPAGAAAGHPPSTLSGAASQVGSVAPAPARGRGGRWIIAAIGAVAIAAIGAGALALVGSSRREPPPAVTRADAPPVVPLRPPELGQAFVDGYATASGAQLVQYGSAGAWESAARDFEIAAAQPDAPTRWQAGALGCAGEAALLRGAHADADALLTRAVALAPDWAWLQVGLAGTRAVTGDQPGAITAAHEAQRLAPRWWLAIAMEARVYRHGDQLDLAIEHYQRALQVAPDEAALLSELALVYHAARLDAEAERYARRALELDADVTSARLLLAERALERGDGATALKEAEHLVAVNPRSATGQLARADALFAVGRKAEALEVYKKAIALEDETDQGSIPPARLAEVRAALASGARAERDLARQKVQRSKTQQKRVRSPRREGINGNGKPPPTGPARSKCDPADPLCGL